MTVGWFPVSYSRIRFPSADLAAWTVPCHAAHPGGPGERLTTISLSRFVLPDYRLAGSPEKS